MKIDNPNTPLVFPITLVRRHYDKQITYISLNDILQLLFPIQHIMYNTYLFSDKYIIYCYYEQNLSTMSCLIHIQNQSSWNWFCNMKSIIVTMKKIEVGCNTISQGREALEGSPFLWERDPHAMKPPKPEVVIHNVENIIFKSNPEWERSVLYLLEELLHQIHHKA